MVERRKSKDEIAAELDLPQPDDGEGQGENGNTSPGSDGAGEFVPFSEEERQEVCNLFDLLIDAGYITCGDYRVQGDESGRKVVTLSAFLPSTLDADPRNAGESDG